MVAKKGPKTSHHFGHYKKNDCHGEGNLHKMAMKFSGFVNKASTGLDIYGYNALHRDYMEGIFYQLHISRLVADYI